MQTNDLYWIELFVSGKNTCDYLTVFKQMCSSNLFKNKDTYKLK